MKMHALSFTLEFPAGIAAGDGEKGNVQVIARNGAGHPVLRGTALSGVIRHAYSKYIKEQSKPPHEVESIFGKAEEGKKSSGCGSALKVQDSVLKSAFDSLLSHTFHQRNRHTGSVLEGALFSIETCPPKTEVAITLWLEERSVDIDVETFIPWLARTLHKGILLGGNSNRGIGLGVLKDNNFQVASFDLLDIKDHANYLDAKVDEDKLKNFLGDNYVFAKDSADKEELNISFTLRIPRGQDILIGDGQGIDFKMEPQRVTAGDKNDYWRLPGSTLRGLFRDWTSRLAVREGKQICDTVENFQNFQNTYNGDAIGWMFADDDIRKNKKAMDELHSKNQIANLFGSLHKAGRIHIADSYAKVSDTNSTTREMAENEKSEIQKRTHVAIDAISGNAVEHMLFDNAVLISSNNESAEWKVKIKIKNPSENEARWISQSLKALDIGLLRIGSSKSAGRLELKEVPNAVGLNEDTFLKIWGE